MTTTPEPMDKLDAAATVVVSGPADDPPLGADRRASSQRIFEACLSRMHCKVQVRF
jgi:hypothetical protein